MARLFPDEGKTRVNTPVVGTNGYMAPEYLMHGHLSEMAYVFSFGVIVLEIVSGKKNSNFEPLPEAQSLLEWVWKLFKTGRSIKAMDPTCASSTSTEQVKMCIHIGLLCTQGDPKLRPPMSRVVNLLSKNQHGDLVDPTRPGFVGRRYGRHSFLGSTSYGISSSSHSAESSQSSGSSSMATVGISGTSNPTGQSTSKSSRASFSEQAFGSC